MPTEVLPHSRQIIPASPITAASLPRLYPGLWQVVLTITSHAPTNSHRVAALLRCPWGDKSYCRVFILPFFNMFKGSGLFF